ncbi:MAG: TetR/AcrR family transcriptional regulator [Anaerolineales bacterium]|nr:TetR/AcrR family transcriptional regulator [Anaerolineales bacterium]
MPRSSYHHGDLKNALIQAGTEILSTEGVSALSLRRVASKAGVSHSAPYAHFADKQALIAAISTEGFRLLYKRLLAEVEADRDDPTRMLVEVAYAYLMFARAMPAYFKIMFSGILEKEQEYPDFVDLSKKNFQLLVGLVQQCQSAGLLQAGAPEVLAVSIWSLVHGFTALLLERQIPGAILDQYELKALLIQALNQITLVDIS